MNINHNLATPTGRLEFARDALGSRCPDPTIVKEQKVHLWTGPVSVDKYTADIIRPSKLIARGPVRGGVLKLKDVPHAVRDRVALRARRRFQLVGR